MRFAPGRGGIRHAHRSVALVTHRARADDHDVGRPGAAARSSRLSAAPESPPERPSRVAAPSMLDTKLTRTPAAAERRRPARRRVRLLGRVRPEPVDAGGHLPMLTRCAWDACCARRGRARAGPGSPRSSAPRRRSARTSCIRTMRAPFRMQTTIAAIDPSSRCPCSRSIDSPMKSLFDTAASIGQPEQAELVEPAGQLERVQGVLVEVVAGIDDQPVAAAPPPLRHARPAPAGRRSTSVTTSSYRAAGFSMRGGPMLWVITSVASRRRRRRRPSPDPTARWCR